MSSTLESAILEDDVTMGPYCHLRKGAYLATGVHLGNYAEVKDSYLGPRQKWAIFHILEMQR